MRLLDGPGSEVEFVRAVVVTVVGERLVRPCAAQHIDRLAQPGQTHPGRVERQSGLIIIGAHPARSNAQFETSLGEKVKRGRLLGQNRGMPIVIGQHHGAEPEARTVLGRRGKRDHRRVTQAREVIVDQQDVDGAVVERAYLVPPDRW